MDGARLLLYGREAAPFEDALEPADLDGLLRRLLREGGPAARIAWERAGVLGLRHLLARWQEDGLLRLTGLRTAVLRSPRHFYRGLALQIETDAPAADLPGVAADLARLLRARGAVHEVEARPLPEPPEREVLAAGGETAGSAPRLQPADLPWILPGERLWAPRRGCLRVKRVEGDGRRFVLQDEAGARLVFEAEEILAHFRRASREDAPAAGTASS